MEAGMMASFTIYEPSSKPCPLQFVSGNFWNADKYDLTVKNVSGKKIKSFTLAFEHFVAPQFLRHPFLDTWASSQPFEAGSNQTVEMKAYSGGGQNILGWVLLPSKVLFEDGSMWKPQARGECFGVYWRDEDHPELKVLPPEQVEMNQD